MVQSAVGSHDGSGQTNSSNLITADQLRRREVVVVEPDDSRELAAATGKRSNVAVSGVSAYYRLDGLQ